VLMAASMVLLAVLCLATSVLAFKLFDKDGLEQGLRNDRFLGAAQRSLTDREGYVTRALSPAVEFKPTSTDGTDDGT